jgi:hypothetical protein
MEEVGKQAGEARPARGGLIGTATAIGALLTAVAGLLAGLRELGVFGQSPKQPDVAPAALSEADTGAREPTIPNWDAARGDGTPDIVGAWTWKGQSCTDGPRVARDGDRLVFTTPSTRFVHRVLSHKGDELRTEVISPATHAGEIYRFHPGHNTLQVAEDASGERNLWTRCPE